MNISMVTNGKPAATLLTRPDATPFQRRLEKELQSLLRRLTGANLPTAPMEAAESVTSGSHPANWRRSPLAWPP